MTPDGKPETLYDLCDLTYDSIAALPLNYYQGNWICRASDKFGDEACGTAYCRAGWMAAHLAKPGTILTDYQIYVKAEGLLLRAGVPLEDVEALFSASALDNEANVERHQMGTPEYTAAGIAGMRAFMAKHETLLRAAPVSVEDD